MRKFGVLSSFLFFTILSAGIFGIIHDQITYTLAPEYFTKFKFIQFQTAPALPDRLAVDIVGFFATYWMGLFIGILFGIIGLFFPDHKLTKKYLLKAIKIVIVSTIILAFTDYIAGRFYFITHIPSFFYIPADLMDKKNFVIVGCIHTASYIGGFAGAIIGIIFLIRSNIFLKKT